VPITNSKQMESFFRCEERVIEIPVLVYLLIWSSITCFCRKTKFGQILLLVRLMWRCKVNLIFNIQIFWLIISYWWSEIWRYDLSVCYFLMSLQRKFNRWVCFLTESLNPYFSGFTCAIILILLLSPFNLWELSSLLRKYSYVSLNLIFFIWFC
jgi:hypothetical protein